MDDTAAKENPSPDFNKLDLNQLQSFSFGTQWTQDKAAPRDHREERPRRDSGDRRPAPREGGDVNRDRRAFRRPAGPAAAGAGPARTEGAAPSGGRPPRREPEGRGAPYRAGPGGDRHERGGPRAVPEPRLPYDSPFFSASFYPEDVSLAALAKTIRASCRTLELFEIARTILGKNDRFVVVVQRKPAAGAPAESAPAAKPELIWFSVPDGLPFETEEAALAHVVTRHFDKFFDQAVVEIDPPKGNFQVVNRCTITGELLAPPNYHRYGQIIQRHHAEQVSRMSFERFTERIESVRDPEIISQWLEKMKRTTRYTWKVAAPETPAAAPAVPPASESAAPAADPAQPAAPAPETPKPEATAPVPGPSFDSMEEARVHLLAQARDKVIRAFEHARFHGKIIETLPPGEIQRTIEGQLERQRRFPLDTANGLRGRLRREGFTIFKKGSKGVSYVCAVKRKFRVPGQVFADSINGLITFIETHPMVRAGVLPEKFLGLPPPTKAAAPSAPAVPAAADQPAPEAPAAETPAPALTPVQREKLSRMQGDLRWLVSEGYVTEFMDGRLFAPPPLADARKKEAETEEHDPENFPEAPADPAEPKPAVEAPAAAAAPVPDVPATPPFPEENTPTGGN